MNKRDFFNIQKSVRPQTLELYKHIFEFKHNDEWDFRALAEDTINREHYEQVLCEKAV